MPRACGSLGPAAGRGWSWPRRGDIWGPKSAARCPLCLEPRAWNVAALGSSAETRPGRRGPSAETAERESPRAQPRAAQQRPRGGCISKPETGKKASVLGAGLCSSHPPGGPAAARGAGAGAPRGALGPAVARGWHGDARGEATGSALADSFGAAAGVTKASGAGALAPTHPPAAAGDPGHPATRPRPVRLGRPSSPRASRRPGLLPVAGSQRGARSAETPEPRAGGRLPRKGPPSRPGPRLPQPRVGGRVPGAPLARDGGPCEQRGRDAGRRTGLGRGTQSNQEPVECNSRSIAAPNKCNRF